MTYALRILSGASAGLACVQSLQLSRPADTPSLKMSNIFQFRRELVDEYASFSRSCTRIGAKDMSGPEQKRTERRSKTGFL